MTEQGNSPPMEASDNDAFPHSGDPSMELFGNGWTPNPKPTRSDSYTGRHRAPDG
jgi:hypothetical protein